MVTRNFTLYDLLADIVPGALFILFSFILYGYPASNTLSKTGLVAGGAFFVLSYFLGRLIHTIGSIVNPCLKRINKKLTNWEKNSNDSNCADKDECSINNKHFNLELEELLEMCGYRGSINKCHVPCGISTKTMEDVHVLLSQEIGMNYNKKEAKRYGETIIYQNTTLYSKYEALVTFFRSIFLLPLSFSLDYLS